LKTNYHNLLKVLIENKNTILMLFYILPIVR